MGNSGRTSRDKYELSGFSVPGIVRGSGDTALSKADEISALRWFSIRVGGVEKINMKART